VIKLKFANIKILINACLTWTSMKDKQYLRKKNHKKKTQRVFPLPQYKLLLFHTSNMVQKLSQWPLLRLKFSNST